MKAHVNVRDSVVCFDDQKWPFELNCRVGTVTMTLQDRQIRLRRFSWREKCILARFVHLGEDYLKNQFIRVSLVEEEVLVASEPEREAIWTLSRWLNAPDGGFGLPLDQRLLAGVTFDLCRAMHVTPSVLESLEAGEVELLWEAAHGSGAPEVAREPAEEPASTRILVVSDPDPESNHPETTQTADHPEARSSLSAASPTRAPRASPQTQKPGARRQGNNATTLFPAAHPHNKAPARDLEVAQDKPPPLRPTRTTAMGSRDRFRVIAGPVRTSIAQEDSPRLDQATVTEIAMQPAFDAPRRGTEPSGVTPVTIAMPVAAGPEFLVEMAASTAAATALTVPPAEFDAAKPLSSTGPASGIKMTSHETSVTEDKSMTTRGVSSANGASVIEPVWDRWLDAFVDRLQEAANAVGVDVEV